MDRKKCLFIIILITFILFFVFVFTEKNIVYNNVIISSSEFDNITKTRKKSNELIIEKLEFNDYALLLENSTNTFYYSLIENNKNAYNPVISYTSKGNNTKISFVEEKIDDDLIANNKKIKLVIYNDNEYNIYYILCTKLPLINIKYDSNAVLNHETNEKMEFYLFDNSSNAVNRVVNSEGYIHIRGASTSSYPKKGFKLSLTKKSPSENERKNYISLLNMRQDDDWILYAGYNDQEKIRNVFATNLWYDSCADNNSFNVTAGNQYKYVELFINNEYWGLYALGYQPDEKQLNLTKDSYGNYNEYLFKKISWEQSELWSKNKIVYMKGYELVSEDNSTAANHLLSNYYHILQNTTISNDIYNIIDVDNTIDYFLFNELILGADNPHAMSIKNVFIVLKKENNLYKTIYVPWDLDMALGNLWNETYKNYTIEYGNESLYNNFKLNGVYFLNKLGDKEIVEKTQNRYNQLRQNQWSDENITETILNYQSKIFDSGAFLRDKNRWPDGNYISETIKLSKFNDFVIQRLKYMDDYVNSLQENL